MIILSIRCGGYYIAVDFQNKENITNGSIYNKDLDGNNTFKKFHMNKLIELNLKSFLKDVK